jgi:AcrR family transcriptional regulator
MPLRFRNQPSDDLKTIRFEYSDGRGVSRYPLAVPELPQHFKRAPVGSDQVSKDVLAQHQRERVLTLVTDLFAKRGYQGTTVDDLLEAGKVGVENFYTLFEGKEDCFLSTYETILDRARRRVLLAAAGGSWDERAVRGLREALAFAVEEPRAARIVLIEAQAAGAEATRRYEELLDAITAWLVEGRRAHPGAGSLPDNFERASVAGLAYYLQQCLLGGGPDDLEGLFAEVSSMVLGPLLGTPELRRLCGAAVPA